MTYENGEYVPFSPHDYTHPEKEEEKDISHRRFTTTIQKKQLYEAFKISVRKGEQDADDLMTLFRIIADSLNKSDDRYNIKMWEHIKSRTEKAIRKIQQRRGRRGW